MALENQDALLEEYCRWDEKIGRIDSLVWQMAAIMLPITLARIAYFGQLKTHTKSQFFMILIVAIGSLTLLFTWFFLARQ